MKTIKTLIYGFFLMGFLIQVRAENIDLDKANQKAILYYVNEYRAKHHLKPLQLDARMSAEAAKHSGNSRIGDVFATACKRRSCVHNGRAQWLRFAPIKSSRNSMSTFTSHAKSAERSGHGSMAAREMSSIPATSFIRCSARPCAPLVWEDR